MSINVWMNMYLHNGMYIYTDLSPTTATNFLSMGWDLLFGTSIQQYIRLSKYSRSHLFFQQYVQNRNECPRRNAHNDLVDFGGLVLRTGKKYSRMLQYFSSRTIYDKQHVKQMFKPSTVFSVFVCVRECSTQPLHHHQNPRSDGSLNSAILQHAEQLDSLEDPTWAGCCSNMFQPFQPLQLQSNWEGILANGQRWWWLWLTSAQKKAYVEIIKPYCFWQNPMLVKSIVMFMFARMRQLQ